MLIFWLLFCKNLKKKTGYCPRCFGKSYIILIIFLVGCWIRRRRGGSSGASPPRPPTPASTGLSTSLSGYWRRHWITEFDEWIINHRLHTRIIDDTGQPYDIIYLLYKSLLSLLAVWTGFISTFLILREHSLTRYNNHEHFHMKVIVLDIYW